MSKIFKKTIVIAVLLAFAISLIPFGAFAETNQKTTAKITDANKLKGYFSGKSSDLNNNTVSNYPFANNMTDSNRRITYFHYNVSDYLKYSDTSFTFSLRHGGQSGDYTYNYDVYLVKGTCVDVVNEVATSKLNMNYMITENLVIVDSGIYKKYPLNEESDKLVKIGSYTGGKDSSRTEKYVVTESAIKSAVGDNGWVTFIINDVHSDDNANTIFKANSADTYLGVDYDENSIYEDKKEPSLTVENGVATAKVDVTNGTAQDESYKLYLAEYNNEELIQLVPMDMSATKYFKTTKTLTANVASGNKVKFFVWSADGITPVCEAPIK